MKKSILTCAAAALLALPSAMAAAPGDAYAKMVKRYELATQRTWQHTGKAAGPAKEARTQPDGVLDPASTYGSFLTPEGEEWLYTAKYTYDANGSIEKVKFNVYDASLKQYSEFEIDLELAEGDVNINYVAPVQGLTKKFFNIDGDYEVMVYIHATTPDFSGHNYTKVYSLKDGTLIGDFEGNNVGMVNTAQDKWSENYTLAFMHERFDEDNNYFMTFDIYGKAGWDGGPQLLHTFDINYKYVSGSGDAAMPFLMTANGDNKMMYALPHYEKPFFANDDFFSEPEVSTDNNFIIDLYDADFNMVKQTVIPMDSIPGYIYSFPGVGILNGFNDMTFGVFDDSKDTPVYVVGYENYVTSQDDFICDFYVYDADGQKIATIFNEAADYIWLTDIPGCEKQYCFYKSDEGTFTTVDFPSCQVASVIPITTDEGYLISTEFDRTPYGDSYLYITTSNTADVDMDENLLHNIIWIKQDGDTHHRHTINLGQNIALAMPYINSDVFNPFLFNTDTDYEYLFLIKEYLDKGGSANREVFRIISENNETILDMGPDDNGDYILNVFIMNPATSPVLAVVYYGRETGYTVKHFSLPLTKFAGGDGSAENPFLLSKPGDVMAMYQNPRANFALANDIDFEGYQWGGNDCTFQGTLNGNGHTLSGLNISGPGIFESLGGSARVSDLIIENSHLNATVDAGFIAGYAGSNGANNPVTVSNVRVYNSTISGANACIGGILGNAVVFTRVEDCAVKYVDIEVEGNQDIAAGGIVGSTRTSPTIANCLFEGNISARTAGGIVGEAYTSDATIANCHVNADINADYIAGGIYGYSMRVNISQCFVEGNIAANGTDKAYAGGIAGYLENVFEEEKRDLVIIQNNIVAATSITANPSANKSIAHRIVGFSGSDYLMVDWDNVTEGMDSKDYPMIAADPDKGLSNNYALLDIIDSNVADAGNTPEGKTITFAGLTDQLLADAGWKFGTTAEEPWVKGQNGFALYFEDKDNVTGIDTVAKDVAEKIAFDGSELRANGKIQVSNLAGVTVATGRDALSVSHLPAGVYVAVCGSKAIKFTVK